MAVAGEVLLKISRSGNYRQTKNKCFHTVLLLAPVFSDHHDQKCGYKKHAGKIGKQCDTRSLEIAD
jgi:hypothetical protein